METVDAKLKSALVGLAKKLKTKTLILEASMSRNRRSVDIICWGETHDGKTVSEFNFESNFTALLQKALSMAPSGQGLRLKIDASGLVTSHRITERERAGERQALTNEVAEQDERQRQNWRGGLSDQPFGMELSEQVCKKLSRESLCYSHRDYCGMGFEKRGGIIFYGEFEDGSFCPSTISREFKSEIEFTTWLSRQTDRSLARLGEAFFEGNQTVTLSRLVEFVRN